MISPTLYSRGLPVMLTRHDVDAVKDSKDMFNVRMPVHRTTRIHSCNRVVNDTISAG
jgi:hypothetical protein